MVRSVTININEDIERSARAVAARTGRRLDRYAADMPLDTLPDSRVLELSHAQMPDDQQRELSDLLALSREGELDERSLARLDELMLVYRQALKRKAEALHIAVKRGLRPPVG
jgi:hypothetical protein